jgi:hypothetical protein
MNPILDIVLGIAVGVATEFAAMALNNKLQTPTTPTTPGGAVSTAITPGTAIGGILPLIAPGIVGYVIGGGYGALGAILGQGGLALMMVGSIH